MKCIFFCLKIQLTARYTRTDTLFPYTTLFRARLTGDQRQLAQARLQGGAEMLLQVGTCVLEIRRHHFAELAREVIDGFEVNHGVVSVLAGHYRRSAASAQSEKCALCCKKMLTPTHRGRERASIKPPHIVMKGSRTQPIKT